MSEEIVKRRGRRALDISKRATAKNITLYDNHFKIINDNNIELSNFSRWLAKNYKEEYNQSDKKDSYEGNSTITSVSLYNEDYELIKDINNFSNFLRWGLENKINDYIKE